MHWAHGHSTEHLLTAFRPETSFGHGNSLPDPNSCLRGVFASFRVFRAMSPSSQGSTFPWSHVFDSHFCIYLPFSECFCPRRFLRAFSKGCEALIVSLALAGLPLKLEHYPGTEVCSRSFSRTGLGNIIYPRESLVIDISIQSTRIQETVMGDVESVVRRPR